MDSIFVFSLLLIYILFRFVSFNNVLVLDFNHFIGICQNLMTMSNDQKEKSEKMIRDYVEKRITLEEIKNIFRQSSDNAMIIISLELIEKYVINNANCTLHKRLQNFQPHLGI